MITKSKTLEIINAVMKLRETATDEQAVEMIMIYPVWKRDTEYNAGERIRYNGNLYKVISEHISSDDSTPEIAVELYTKI